MIIRRRRKSSAATPAQGTPVKSSPASQAADVTGLLSYSLQENITYLQNTLKGCDDFTYRSFTTAAATEGILVYSHFMVDSNFISETVLPALFALDISPDQEFWAGALKTSLPFLPEKPYTLWDDILNHTLAGHTLILLNGVNAGYIVDTAKIEGRLIDKPSTELVVRGPNEAFAEKLGPNLAIIRSRLKNPYLKLQNFKLGEDSHTSAVLLYLEGAILPEVLADVRTRLSNIPLRSVQDTGYLVEFLVQRSWTPFPLVQSTERPDRAIASLIEGCAVIMVEGSPYAMSLPAIFWGFFQAPDDYYQSFLIGSIVRLIRYFAFMLASALPAFYIAGTVFHPEMIPLRLLLTLSSARLRVPIPTWFEVFSMLVVLDIFREATLRLPRTLGPAIGIIGALVIGEAAVTAGVISPMMIIVLSLTAISTFVIPTEDMRGAARLFSYFLCIMASILGLYGFLLGTSMILLHLCSLESLGIPYLSPVATLQGQEWTDVLLRAPWHILGKKLQRWPGRNGPTPGRPPK